MSAAEQFKAAVTSASVPDQGWRGGLERMPRKAEGGQLMSTSWSDSRYNGWAEIPMNDHHGHIGKAHKWCKVVAD
jgi:hypothetical protein